MIVGSGPTALSAAGLPGYVAPRPQIDYPNGTVVYLDATSSARTAPAAQSTTTVSSPIMTPRATPSASSSPFLISRQLWDEGPDILSLQQWFNANGFPLASTGPGSPGNETITFGLHTYAALIKFQEANNLPATGLLRTTHQSRDRRHVANCRSIVQYRHRRPHLHQHQNRHHRASGQHGNRLLDHASDIDRSNHNHHFNSVAPEHSAPLPPSHNARSLFCQAGPKLAIPHLYWKAPGVCPTGVFFFLTPRPSSTTKLPPTLRQHAPPPAPPTSFKGVDRVGLPCSETHLWIAGS